MFPSWSRMPSPTKTSKCGDTNWSSLSPVSCLDRVSLPYRLSRCRHCTRSRQWGQDSSGDTVGWGFLWPTLSTVSSRGTIHPLIVSSSVRRSWNVVSWSKSSILKRSVFWRKRAVVSVTGEYGWGSTLMVTLFILLTEVLVSRVTLSSMGGGSQLLIRSLEVAVVRRQTQQHPEPGVQTDFSTIGFLA